MKVRQERRSRDLRYGLRPRHYSLRLKLAVAIAVLLTMQPARADSEPASKSTESRELSASATAPPASSSVPYLDRFMDSVPNLSSSELPDDGPKPAGYRQLSVVSTFATENLRGETSYSGGKVSQLENRRATIFVDYRQQTAQFGDVLFQFGGEYQPPLAIDSVAARPDAASNKFRVLVQNNGYALSTASALDSKLGDFSPAFTDAASRAHRFSMGGNLIRGFGTHYYSDQWDIRGAVGQRGQSAIGQNTFTATKGAEVTLGLGFKHATGWQLGAQFLADSPSEVDPDEINFGTVPRRAAIIGATYKNDAQGISARALLVAERKSPATLFGEMVYASGRSTHTLAGSVATAGPTSAALPGLGLNNLFYRYELDYPGWRASIATDWSKPAHVAPDISAPGRAMSIVGSGMFRYSPQTSFGGSASAKEATPLSLGPSANRQRSYSVDSWIRQRTGIGEAVLALTHQSNVAVVEHAPLAHGTSATWTQQWITAHGGEQTPLSTTVGLARETQGNAVVITPIGAVDGYYKWGSEFSSSANLSYRGIQSNLATTRGLAGRVTLDWSPDSAWQVSVRASMNESRVETSSGTAVVTRSRAKAAFLTVRWLGVFGKPFEVAGARGSGRGTATVRGVVFADLNRNEIRDQQEPGVPGVEVYADGQQMAITDKEGRFEFPIVTTGSHLLMLRTNSIPLPFGHSREPFRKIDLRPRDVLNVSIPVQRVTE